MHGPGRAGFPGIFFEVKLWDLAVPEWSPPVPLDSFVSIHQPTLPKITSAAHIKSFQKIRPSNGMTSHHRTSDARVAPRGARKRPKGDHGRPSADDVESLSVGTEAGTGPQGLSPTGFPVIAERLA